MEMQIRVEGLERALRRLRDTPRALNRALIRAMDTSVLLLQAGVSRYPPKLVGSTYDRKGRLGRSWVSGVVKIPRVQGYVENPIRYAPYVVGDETQVAVHKGRWMTIGKRAEKLQPKMEMIFQQELDKAIKEIER